MKNQSFVNPNAKLKLEKIALSENPEAKVVDDPDGLKGKINEGVDGRKYYIAHFSDPHNPFIPQRIRVVAQTTNSAGEPVWRVPNAKQMASFIGKEIPGAIVTRMVEPYVVDEDRDPVDSYTTVVFGNEPIEQVFARAGHQIIGVDTVTVEADPETVMSNTQS